MTTRRDDILGLLEARAARNGGSRPPQAPPPTPPTPPVATGDAGEGDDEPFMRQAMQEVLNEALSSSVNLHRDAVGAASLILLSRIAVELSVIRAVVLGGAQDRDGDEWRGG